MAKTWFVDVDDDTILLFRKKELFYWATHDDVGWAGLGMLEQLAEAMNKAGVK